MVNDDALFSPDWFRVSGLVLRLRPTLRIGRQRLSGRIWHVYRDEATGRQLRLNDVAHEFAARLDGRLSVQVVWDQQLSLAGDEAPSQHEVIALIQQLADAGMVSAENGVDLVRLSRSEARRRRQRMLSTVNPLAFKVPLFDPSRLLDRTWRVAAPLYTGWALAAIVALVVLAAAVAFEHAAALRAYAATHVPSPGFGLALWLVYPPIKALHELAHAWAVRVWGGRVREVGVTLMVGMPVPYVDASAAALFASRAQRVAVSLAGIAVELLVAAAALWVWLSVSDGWVRTAAFAAMTVGTVSTLLVNGNPLMRFDAYHALSDAADLPNLAERSRQAWSALARRAIAGERDAALPPGPAGDLPWLIGWGAASWIWRVLVFAWLAAFVAPWSFAVALAVLAWGAWLVFGRAAIGVGRYLLRAPWRLERPVRALAGAGLAGAAIGVLAVAVPLPEATTLPGVVMPADTAKVRAAQAGRVTEVAVSRGQAVVAGAVLVRMQNEALAAERAQLSALRAAHETERIRALESDRVASGVALDELERTRARLAEVERRIAALQVVAPTDGVVAFVDTDGPIDRHVRQGEVLLYVLQPGSMRIQVLARDDQARRVSEPGSATPEARVADLPGTVLAVRVAAQTPQAVHELPGPALGERAGGPIPTDPADRDARRTLEPWFQLEFLPQAPLARIGASAQVRVVHPPRPAAVQAGDALRRLFLRRIDG